MKITYFGRNVRTIADSGDTLIGMGQSLGSRVAPEDLFRLSVDTGKPVGEDDTESYNVELRRSEIERLHAFAWRQPTGQQHHHQGGHPRAKQSLTARAALAIQMALGVEFTDDEGYDGSGWSGDTIELTRTEGGPALRITIEEI